MFFFGGGNDLQATGAHDASQSKAHATNFMDSPWGCVRVNEKSG